MFTCLSLCLSFLVIGPPFSFKEPSNIEHIIRACGQSMLICQIKEDMKLPLEFSSTNISESSMTKFLVVCTSLETKLKAETINHDVIRMLRQKHSILHQISELSRRLKEVNSVKVGCSRKQFFFV